MKQYSCQRGLSAAESHSQPEALREHHSGIFVVGEEIEDAAEADRVFDMLMGSSVPPRRRFITTHAKNATLDV